MAMLIAWQVINKVTYPQDARFSKHVFVVAPGLTVKSRLQVLLPAGKGNFYDEFNVVPGSLLDKLRQGRVLIRNWHGLNWETEEKLARKKTVDKRGAKSNEAYVKEVLGEIATARSLVVINDEAHHVYGEKRGRKGEEAQYIKWSKILQRIGKAARVSLVIDLSATAASSSLQLPVPKGMVRSVRTGARPGGELRVVFEAAQRLLDRGRLRVPGE